MHSDHKEIESEFTPQNWALVVWGVMLSGLIFGITPLIAVIIAYVQRNRLRGTSYASHMRHAILTFWVATVLNLVAIAFATWKFWTLFNSSEPFDSNLNPIVFMFTLLSPSLIALLVINLWFIIVCVKGLVLAGSAAPYRAWLGII